MALGSVVAAVTALALLILIRFLYIVLQSGKSLHGKSQKPYSTLVILGSGKLVDDVLVSFFLYFIRSECVLV